MPEPMAMSGGSTPKNEQQNDAGREMMPKTSEMIAAGGVCWPCGAMPGGPPVNPPGGPAGGPP